MYVKIDKWSKIKENKYINKEKCTLLLFTLVIIVATTCRL